jgi:hypothetical protein
MKPWSCASWAFPPPFASAASAMRSTSSRDSTPSATIASVVLPSDVGLTVKSANRAPESSIALMPVPISRASAFSSLKAALNV